MTAAAAAQPPVLCAVYLRISLDRNNDGLAVDRQREDCLRIARERGWQVVEEYVDNSISAFDKNVKRPAYDRMVADYQAGRFGAIVCWDLDRLTRQPRQLEDWIDAAEERGLRLVTANGEADLATTGGVLFAGIKAQVARSEMKQKSVRQKAGLAQRAEMGRPPVGRPAFGYDGAGNAKPDEAPLVTEVFRRFAAGDSLLSIARWLTEAGVPPRQTGKMWRASSVRFILTNPRYTGAVVYGGEVLEGKVGNWPALVEPELYAAVARILADPRRKTGHVGTHRRYLGAGLWLCGRCGQPMQSHSGDSYRCQHGCMTKARRRVDEYILRFVTAELARPDLATLLAPPGDDAKAAQVEARVTALQRKLATANAEIEDPMTEDDDLPGLRRRRRNVEEALARAYAERATLWLGQGGNAVLSAERPDEAFLAAPVNMQRVVVDTLFTVTLLPGIAPAAKGQTRTVPGRGHNVPRHWPDHVRIEYRPR